MNQIPGIKETGPTFSDSIHIRRKKTPSDLRRNALRMAEFLKRKNLQKESLISTEPFIDPTLADESPGNSSDTSADTTEDSINSSMESATPVIEEHPSIVEAAVIEESPSVINTTNDMDTAEVNDPVNLPRNNPKTQDHSQNLSLPSDNTTPVIVLICAADRTAALNRSKQFKAHRSSNLIPVIKNIISLSKLISMTEAFPN